MDMNFIVFFLVCFSFYGRSIHMCKVMINDISESYYSTCISVKKEDILYVVKCDGIYCVNMYLKETLAFSYMAVLIFLWYIYIYIFFW